MGELRDEIGFGPGDRDGRPRSASGGWAAIRNWRNAVAEHATAQADLGVRSLRQNGPPVIASLQRIQRDLAKAAADRNWPRRTGPVVDSPSG